MMYFSLSLLISNELVPSRYFAAFTAGNHLRRFARWLKLFDEISVLCEQFDDLPDELIHVIVRTKDNIGGVGPRMDAEVARGRLQLAAIRLRLDGRPRWERNIQTEIKEFARETIQQLFSMAKAARGRDEKDAPPQAN